MPVSAMPKQQSTRTGDMIANSTAETPAVERSRSHERAALTALAAGAGPDRKPWPSQRPFLRSIVQRLARPRATVSTAGLISSASLAYERATGPRRATSADRLAARGGEAEALGIERHGQRRLHLQDGGDVLGRDLLPARHADLVEHQLRRRIVRPQARRPLDQRHRVAQAPSSGVATTTTSSAAESARSTQPAPDMRDVEDDVAQMRLGDLEDPLDDELVELAPGVEPGGAAQQVEMQPAPEQHPVEHRHVDAVGLADQARRGRGSARRPDRCTTCRSRGRDRPAARPNRAARPARAPAPGRRSRRRRRPWRRSPHRRGRSSPCRARHRCPRSPR